MNNELVRRLMWTGLLTAITALSSLVAHRTAELIWERVFNEEPPGD